MLVATGVNADGRREVLGVKVATSQTKEAWNVFFADLVARGLSGVMLVTSDAHAGLVVCQRVHRPDLAPIRDPNPSRRIRKPVQLQRSATSRHARNYVSADLAGAGATRQPSRAESLAGPRPAVVWLQGRVTGCPALIAAASSARARSGRRTCTPRIACASNGRTRPTGCPR